MVVHCILKPVHFCIKNIGCILIWGKSLIERVMQYFKDRTESVDNYYPCVSIKRKNCNLQHVYLDKVIPLFI